MTSTSYAQASERNDFERGKVVKILESGERKILDDTQPYQIIEVKLTTGENKGETVKVEHGANTTIKDFQLVKVGEEVVLSELGTGSTAEYFIQDKFRLPAVLGIILGFFVLVVALARFRGLASIVGMVVSLAILIGYIVPSIARGADPVITTLIGATGIVFVSIYLAHGFNKRTTIAITSTIISLSIAIGLSYLFVNMAHLFGTGSEEAYSLQFGLFSGLDLRGLLLAGIIIGTLGVLDDITTSLSAAVDELHKANTNLTSEELFKRGLSVGREHITSLVNTLVLAYAGAGLPVILFFLSIKDTQPWWVVLNNELIVEEIVRALVGSSALVFAVPITTFLAAAFYGAKQKSTK